MPERGPGPLNNLPRCGIMVMDSFTALNVSSCKFYFLSPSSLGTVGLLSSMHWSCRVAPKVSSPPNAIPFLRFSTASGGAKSVTHLLNISTDL